MCIRDRSYAEPQRAPKKKKQKKQSRLGLIVALLAAAVVLVGCGVGYMFLRDDGRIVNNLYVAGVDLSGMTKEEEMCIRDRAKAGIPHYTGADSFALNGAFLGYGVDYANLGVETANMVSGILLDGSKPSATPVLTFDNGTATINTDICRELGLNYDELAETFAPLCTCLLYTSTAPPEATTASSPSSAG